MQHIVVSLGRREKKKLWRGETTAPDVEVSKKEEEETKGERNSWMQLRENREESKKVRSCDCTKERRTFRGICSLLCPLPLQIYPDCSRGICKWFMLRLSLSKLRFTTIQNSRSYFRGKKCGRKEIKSKSFIEGGRHSSGLLAERALQMTGGTNARELGRAYRVLI